MSGSFFIRCNGSESSVYHGQVGGSVSLFGITNRHLFTLDQEMQALDVDSFK